MYISQNVNHILITSTYLAFSNVAEAELPTAPNPTPTANPSGILCTVMATTSSMIRFHWLRFNSLEFDEVSLALLA